jgi:hypothetical protein
MAYIQREGGERFVIPSYRDVISKRKPQLKNDILQLSSKYGEFMALQRRGLAQFEVAFSHDAGYLFGECVWHYFKRPSDLIYCEAIPDTTEAYFVIIKNGVVYLDGVFPVEAIAEELVVFTTQKNDFEIYLYGDVPISDQPEEGKFTLDAASVKSFTLLDGPLFEHLPAVKAYQLQLVDVVLRQHGIGVFPVKYVIAVAVVLGLGWMGYSFVTMHKKQMPVVVEAPPPENPYLAFNKALASPSPDEELKKMLANVQRLYTMPGWQPTTVQYAGGKIIANVNSPGVSTEILFNWAERNNVVVKVAPAGYSLQISVDGVDSRPLPKKIYTLDRVISSLVDRLLIVVPGNVLKISTYKSKQVYSESSITIALNEVSLEAVMIIAEQLKGLPLVLTNVALTMNHGVTGTISLQALGN